MTLYGQSVIIVWRQKPEFNDESKGGVNGDSVGHTMKSRTGQKHQIQMTTGSLWKNILLFSLPLVMSQILEVLFNLSDVAVVGKFADYIALGAVGSTTLLVSLFTGFLIGMGAGVNVRTAHKLGSSDSEGAAKTVHSSLLVCSIIGVVICLLCSFSAQPVLALLGTKTEFMEQAVLYLRIYALGMPAMAVYNFGSGVLSACGETKRPLLYLTIAGALNVALNLFFVIVCGMAAEGVALASVIAQYLSAALILAHLFRRKDCCGLRFTRKYFERRACADVLMLGIPSGIQNAIFAVANLFVQAGVNHFDAIMVSGNSAAANADTIIFNVMAAFYTACASFVSCNRGAGNTDRMKKSFIISLVYSFAAGALLGGLLLVFGRQFLSLFANDAEVIEAGMQRLGIMGWSYMIAPFMDCTIAASRGIGKSIAPTVIVVMGSCVFRVIWVYTIFAYFQTIPSLYLLYSFSWSITAVAEIIYFVVSFRKMLREKNFGNVSEAA